MSEHESLSSAEIQPRLPDGWTLTGQAVVPLGAMLHFRRTGAMGPEFTVFGADFADAWRKGCDWAQHLDDR